MKGNILAMYALYKFDIEFAFDWLISLPTVCACGLAVFGLKGANPFVCSQLAFGDWFLGFLTAFCLGSTLSLVFLNALLSGLYDLSFDTGVFGLANSFDRFILDSETNEFALKPEELNTSGSGTAWELNKYPG